MKNSYQDLATADQAPGRKRLYVLGLLSVFLFWLPLLAPLIQFISVIESLRVARWGVASHSSLAVGLGGAGLGFVLFLILEFIWVI